MEKTLAIIKPDVTRRHLEKQALEDIKKHFTVEKQLNKHITAQEAELFYIEHKEKAFFPALVQNISSGESIILVLSGNDVVNKFRGYIGATNPAQAADGTLRKKYGINLDYNSFHGSDSQKSSTREINIFFAS